MTTAFAQRYPASKSGLATHFRVKAGDLDRLRQLEVLQAALSCGDDITANAPVMQPATPTQDFGVAFCLGPGYVVDMSVEAIKNAIVHLSEPERKQLANWFEELGEEAWDRQLEQDFSTGGRGVHLLEEVKADVAAGRIKSMDEFLAEAKAKRETPKTDK